METNKVLRELNACATLCNICYQECLKEEDVKMLAQCIQLDRDCADICQLAASYFARGSAHTEKLLRFCADICEQCAEECGKHSHDHCEKCAMACRTCAEMCRAYRADVNQVTD
jgi:hypothetical protein